MQVHEGDAMALLIAMHWIHRLGIQSVTLLIDSKISML